MNSKMKNPEAVLRELAQLYEMNRQIETFTVKEQHTHEYDARPRANIETVNKRKP